MSDVSEVVRVRAFTRCSSGAGPERPGPQGQERKR
jgi:hypothetical protein